MPSGVQRFVISGGELGNRCKAMPVYDLLRAVILDFMGQTWQSLQGMPGIALLRAAIRDFRGQTWQSLQRLPGIGPLACSDS